MSPDPYISPCLRIHVSESSNLRILCKIHVSDSCLSIHVSASLYLRILCKIHVSGVSASLYLRLLCKIHVFGFVFKHPYVSQDPLQDPCLRIHVSASICISGTSARSMSPDSCLSIHMYLRNLCKIHVSNSCLNILSIRYCAPAQAKRKF